MRGGGAQEEEAKAPSSLVGGLSGALWQSDGGAPSCSIRWKTVVVVALKAKGNMSLGGSSLSNPTAPLEVVILDVKFIEEGGEDGWNGPGKADMASG